MNSCPSKKVLIVDDNKVLLKALSMKLKLEGYDVLTAEDGAEAVGMVRHEVPDIILLDLTFPPDVAHGGGIAWDGFLIMDWLHQRVEEAQGIPIVILTAADPAKYRDRALAAGAARFVQKPIEAEDLVRVIREVLGEPAAAGA